MDFENKNIQNWQDRFSSLQSVDSSSNVTVFPALPQFQLPTVPLYSIVAALGWQEVDFFHLNLDGGILCQVLKSFPFNLVTFKVLIVNVVYCDLLDIIEIDGLLLSQGYSMAKHVKSNGDVIYVHEKYIQLLKNVKYNELFISM